MYKISGVNTLYLCWFDTYTFVYHIENKQNTSK
jgi:hypothetical protein